MAGDSVLNTWDPPSLSPSLCVRLRKGKCGTDSPNRERRSHLYLAYVYSRGYLN